MALRVLIGGGTGFVGTHLSRALSKRGHEVTLLARKKNNKSVHPIVTWDSIKTSGMPPCDAVVQLAGENIMLDFWTNIRKAQLTESRVVTTKLLVERIKQMPQPPKVFVGASAIGYYPTKEHEIFTEEYAGPPADSFPGKLCSQWEKASLPLEGTMRRVITRLGIVLGYQGMLGSIQLPFSYFVGCAGDGKQTFPWIHIDDAVNLIIYAIEHEEVVGVLNAVAPHVISQAEFYSTYELIFQKTGVPIPALALKWMLGADRAAMLLEGNPVLPKRTQEYGFQFAFKDLNSALTNLRANPPTIENASIFD